MDKFWKFVGKIDDRKPRNEGDFASPVKCENLLSRDGVLATPPGTVKDITTELTGRPTWGVRYDTQETGVVKKQKSFCYTIDGKLWFLDEVANTATEIKDGLNTNAYPKSWLVKVNTQTILYFVDGLKLYKYDGNNDNTFNEVKVEDSNGESVKPIDLIEHKDRLILISQDFAFISKNLEFDVFDNPVDSIQLIVGSGKGSNLALGKIEDILYFMNTQGIFVLRGDSISAVASTFSIDLIEERNIVAGRTAIKVEKAINFLAATDKNIELWSFDGVNTKLLSHNERIHDKINLSKVALDKAVAYYYDNYYMLSFVERGETDNNLEFWWDALGGAARWVRGRDVSFYMSGNPTVEEPFLWVGSSSSNYVLRHAPGERTFNGSKIPIYILTKDLTISKGRNVRITEIFPEIKCTGQNSIDLRYLLDGRLSDLDHEAETTVDLSGEVKTLGLIRIRNQEGVLSRVLPKINYSKGVSIAFEIRMDVDFDVELLGIGISYIDKGDKKNKKVGA